MLRIHDAGEDIIGKYRNTPQALTVVGATVAIGLLAGATLAPHLLPFIFPHLYPFGLAPAAGLPALGAKALALKRGVEVAGGALSGLYSPHFLSPFVGYVNNQLQNWMKLGTFRPNMEVSPTTIHYDHLGQAVNGMNPIRQLGVAVLAEGGSSLDSVMRYVRAYDGDNPKDSKARARLVALSAVMLTREFPEIPVNARTHGDAHKQISSYLRPKDDYPTALREVHALAKRYKVDPERAEAALNAFFGYTPAGEKEKPSTKSKREIVEQVAREAFDNFWGKGWRGALKGGRKRVAMTAKIKGVKNFGWPKTVAEIQAAVEADLEARKVKWEELSEKSQKNEVLEVMERKYIRLLTSPDMKGLGAAVVAQSGGPALGLVLPGPTAAVTGNLWGSFTGQLNSQISVPLSRIDQHFNFASGTGGTEQPATWENLLAERVGAGTQKLLPNFLAGRFNFKQANWFVQAKFDSAFDEMRSARAAQERGNQEDVSRHENAAYHSLASGIQVLASEYPNVEIDPLWKDIYYTEFGNSFFNKKDYDAVAAILKDEANLEAIKSNGLHFNLRLALSHLQKLVQP